jgi:hypothetical protein
MMEGLKHAANMLGELRTSVLSPSNYCALCMCSFCRAHWF